MLVCVIALAGFGIGQSAKRNTRTVSPKPLPTPKQAAIEVQPTPEPSAKRNERPQDSAVNTPLRPAVPQTSKPAYIYEFTRPEFTVPYVRIEHDEQGRGTISFKMRGLDDAASDPIALSPVTLERIKSAMTALNFIDSTEVYQTPRDYSTLGNISITYRKEGRERTVKYNWSENKDAKALMDEYRRISNQYVWQFDMQVARENQPLNAPSLMDELDSYLRRNEISDPKQIVPLLKELSNDERIPLIARDHAGKLAQKIEKGK